MNTNPNHIIAALLNIASAAFRVNHGSHHTGRMLDEVSAEDLESLDARLRELDRLPQPDNTLPLTPSAKAIYYMRPFLEGQKIEPTGFYETNLGEPFKPNDGWVIAKETVVDMPDGTRELGYTTINGFPVFTNEADAHASLAKLSMPLGWVIMKVVQLIPGYVTPEVDADMYTKMLATTADQANRVINDAGLLETLRQLCGYVENGSSEILTIFQDDATREWLLKVGNDGTRRTYNSTSFHQVIREAADKEVEKEECKFCGFAVEFACDAPPPDVCSVAVNAAHRQPISWPQVKVTADVADITQGMKAAEASVAHQAREVMNTLLIEVKDTVGVLTAKRLIREACANPQHAKMRDIPDDQVASVTMKCRDALHDAKHKRDEPAAPIQASVDPSVTTDPARAARLSVAIQQEMNEPMPAFPLHWPSFPPPTEYVKPVDYVPGEETKPQDTPAVDQVQGQGGAFDGGGASGDYQ